MDSILALGEEKEVIGIKSNYRTIEEKEKWSWVFYGVLGGDFHALNRFFLHILNCNLKSLILS